MSNELNKANNRYKVAAIDGLEDGQFLRIFCTPFLSAYSAQPGLVFRCPLCGEVHTHGYSAGHRVEHCFTSAMDKDNPKKYRKDAGPLRDLFENRDPMHYGYYLVPTDDVSKVGFLNKGWRDSLVSIEQADKRQAIIDAKRK